MHCCRLIRWTTSRRRDAVALRRLEVGRAERRGEIAWLASWICRSKARRRFCSIGGVHMRGLGVRLLGDGRVGCTSAPRGTPPPFIPTLPRLPLPKSSTDSVDRATWTCKRTLDARPKDAETPTLPRRDSPRAFYAHCRCRHPPLKDGYERCGRWDRTGIPCIVGIAIRARTEAPSTRSPR